MFAGFGSGVWHRSVLPRLILSFLTGPAESLRVRARAFPLRLSASAPGCDLHRHPPPPNNSFKPTPCRGVGHVLCATLAHVRRPDTGRLNSSVRRQKKRFTVLLFSTVIFCRLRLAMLFGRFPAALLLRSILSGALTHRMRYVCRLRKRCLHRSVSRG